MISFSNLYDVVFDILPQPVWEEIVNKPNGDTPHSHVNATGLTEGGLSAYPAGMASTPPARYGTPKQSSVIIDVESPSPKWHTASERITTVREKIFSCRCSHINCLLPVS